MQLNRNSSLLITGDAGTGKTYTLFHLIRSSILSKSNSIVICSSEQEVNLIKNKLLIELDTDTLPHVTNLESLAYSILNQYNEEGFKEIIKTEEQIKIIIDIFQSKYHIKEYNMFLTGNSPEKIYNMILFLRKLLYNPDKDTYINNILKEIYNDYCNYLAKNNKIDYISVFGIAIKILARINKLFDYVFIDNIQNYNTISQLNFLKNISHSTDKTIATYDAKQQLSLYTYKDIDLYFIKHFNNATKLELTKQYYNADIVNLLNVSKEVCFSDSNINNNIEYNSGDHINNVKFTTYEELINHIINIIKAHKEKKHRLDQIAIIVSSKQKDILIHHIYNNLISSNIPVKNLINISKVQDEYIVRLFINIIEFFIGMKNINALISILTHKLITDVKIDKNTIYKILIDIKIKYNKDYTAIDILNNPNILSGFTNCNAYHSIINVIKLLYVFQQLYLKKENINQLFIAYCQYNKYITCLYENKIETNNIALSEKYEHMIAIDKFTTYLSKIDFYKDKNMSLLEYIEGIENSEVDASYYFDTRKDNVDAVFLVSPYNTYNCNWDTVIIINDDINDWSSYDTVDREYENNGFYQYFDANNIDYQINNRRLYHTISRGSNNNILLSADNIEDSIINDIYNKQSTNNIVSIKEDINTQLLRERKSILSNINNKNKDNVDNISNLLNNTHNNISINNLPMYWRGIYKPFYFNNNTLLNHVSASHLNTLSKCILYWYLNNLSQLNTTSQKIGNMIHELIYNIIQNKVVIDNIEQYCSDYINTHIKDFDYISLQVNTINKIVQAVKRFYYWNANNPREIIASEYSCSQEVELKANNQKILLKGKVDRIEILDNKLYIVDFKMTNSKITQSLANQNLQLAAYYLLFKLGAFDELLNKLHISTNTIEFGHSELVQLYHSQSLKEDHIPYVIIQNTVDSEELINIIMETLTSIVNNDIYLKNNQLCAICNFKHLCPLHTSTMITV